MRPGTSDSAELGWLDDACCVEALRTVEAALARFASGRAVDAAEIVGHLGHGHVGQRLVDVVADDHDLEQLAAFAEALTRDVREREVGPARLLAGLVHLAAGDALAAEQCLDDALRADPRLGLAASVLSVLALDRGDLDRTATLLVRACCPPVDVRWLDRHRRGASARESRVGRNDPCPCGSGRKSKRCCDGGVAVSLKVRSSLMMERLAVYAAGHDVQSIVLGLVLASIGPDVDLADVDDRRDDLFLFDVAVFEGGLAEAYLAERGTLLVEDERDLLERAIAEPRRLWRVVEVDEGTGMRLRLADGSDFGIDTIWLDERSGSVGRRQGEHVLARVLQCEDAWIGLGVPVIVAGSHRARTRDILRSSPGPVEYADWYGTLLAPPALCNREGEPLVLCRAELAPPSPVDVDHLIGVLDGLLAGDGGGANGVWHELFDLGDGDHQHGGGVLLDTFDIEHSGETVVRATVAIAGDRVVVEANSEVRQDRLLRSLANALDAEIVVDERRSAIEAVREHRATPRTRAAAERRSWRAGDPDMPPEAATALEEHMIAYERRWIDGPLPALGGLTPRQALDDPARRVDLDDLLDDIRDRHGADSGLMSIDRIEALLGMQATGTR